MISSPIHFDIGSLPLQSRLCRIGNFIGAVGGQAFSQFDCCDGFLRILLMDAVSKHLMHVPVDTNGIHNLINCSLINLVDSANNNQVLVVGGESDFSSPNTGYYDSCFSIQQTSEGIICKHLLHDKMLARTHCSLVSFSDNVIVGFGGVGEDGTLLNDLFIIHIDEVNSKGSIKSIHLTIPVEVKNAPSARRNASVSVSQGLIILTGGFDSNEHQLSDLYVLDMSAFLAVDSNNAKLSWSRVVLSSQDSSSQIPAEISFQYCQIIQVGSLSKITVEHGWSETIADGTVLMAFGGSKQYALKIPNKDSMLPYVDNTAAKDLPSTKANPTTSKAPVKPSSAKPTKGESKTDNNEFSEIIGWPNNWISREYGSIELDGLFSSEIAPVMLQDRFVENGEEKTKKIVAVFSNKQTCMTLVDLTCDVVARDTDLTTLIYGKTSQSLNSDLSVQVEQNTVGWAIKEYENGDIYEGNMMNGSRNGSGRCVYSNGEIYEGDWRDDKRSGNGICQYSNSRNYEGMWLNDECNGKGQCEYVGDEFLEVNYDGDWLNGLRHGHGECHYKDDSVYSGTWLMGKRSGQGVCKFADGSHYSGSWLDGVCEGSGLHTTPAFIYDGQFQGGKYHGHGHQKMKDCSEYDGEFRSGRRNGNGKLYSRNNDVYEGKFVNGLACGKGKWISCRGEEYDGVWDAGERHGRGVAKDVNGQIYEGGYKKNKRHGHGQMSYANGQLYVGEWCCGDRHGMRKFHMLSQTNQGWVSHGRYNGEWKFDMMNGTGDIEYDNGATYSGGFRNDKREGFGTFWFADGSMYKGDWAANEQSGNGIWEGAKWDGEIWFNGAWQDGRRSGQGEAKYDNGDRYTGGFKNDKRHGGGICRYSDGSVYDGNWEAGERVEFGTLECPSTNEFYAGEWVHDRPGISSNNWQSMETAISRADSYSRASNRQSINTAGNAGNLGEQGIPRSPNKGNRQK